MIRAQLFMGRAWASHKIREISLESTLAKQFI
jgi:hypothetical protein